MLHRLFASGSDRAAEAWKENYHIPGAEELALQHLYRAMAWLGEEIGEGVLGTPRCTKDLIEEALFDRGRDLFSEVGLVFFDTTSIYFEGAGGQSIGRHGHSKDHRPDLHQMVVGVALDVQGRPICCEMWPGNTADAKSLLPVVKRMRAKFRVREMCVVADRGMVSEAILEALGRMEPPVHYIVGVRMRRTREVGEVVLRSRARWQEVTPERQRAKDPAPLKVKEVEVEGRRYIVCLNEEEQRKDAHDSIDEKSYGTEHPNVAIRLNNLARLLQDTNRLAEAEPLMRRALSIDEKSYGTEHPNVAIRLNNLAQLLKDTNRLAEAEPLMRRALSIDEKSYGTEHPNVARDLNNLARLLQDTNRLGEAEPLMKRHLVILMKFTRVTGHPHPHLRDALSNYFALLKDMSLGDEEIRERLAQVGIDAGSDPQSYNKLLGQLL